MKISCWVSSRGSRPGNPELERLGDGLLAVCCLFFVNLAGCLLLLAN